MSIKSFLITLSLGVIISFFLFKGCNKPLPPTPIITAPTELVKKVIAVEKINTVKVDSLKMLLKKADDKVSKLITDQKTADRTILVLRERISAIGNRDPSTDNDYEAGKAELFAEIGKLNRANDQRDSLCDATVYSLQKSGVVKDSIISLKDNLYSNLRMNFDTAISNNIKLLDFTKQQKKTIKKGKAVAFIWKGAAIAAGVFIVKQSL